MDLKIQDNISEVVEICRKKYVVRADFYIGYEPLKRYLQFNIGVKQLKESELKLNIKKLTEKIIFDNQLKDKYFEKDVPHVDFNNLHRRFIYQFHNMNTSRKLGNQFNKLFKNRKIKGNMYEQNEIQVDESQYHQFRTRSELNDKEIQKYTNQDLIKLNRISSRFNSPEKLLKKNNLANYKELYNHFLEKIEQSSDIKCKSLEYYQLEYQLGYYLTTTILYETHKNCKENEEMIKEAFYDLVLLYFIPLVDVRQMYVSIYFELDKDGKNRWRQEILSLKRFIEICLEDAFEKKVRVSQEKFLNESDKYYDISQFRTRYKKSEMGKKDLFKLLMNELEVINKQIKDELDIIMTNKFYSSSSEIFSKVINQRYNN